MKHWLLWEHANLTHVTPALCRESRLPTSTRLIALLIASCVLIASYSPTNAATRTCEFKTNTSAISVFFVGRNGDFFRDGSMVARIEIRGTQIENFEVSRRKNQQREMNGQQMHFEVRKDLFGEENHVYFSFLNVSAVGTAVLKTIEGTSALTMRYRSSSEETNRYNLKYIEPQNLEQILRDAFCLLEYLENE